MFRLPHHPLVCLPPHTLATHHAFTFAGSDKPFGQCRGWRPNQSPTCMYDGYATDDIFFLEACLFNQVCSNGADLFELHTGDNFNCSFSESRFRELQKMLVGGS
mmetsp:Transcript_41155/g.102385  ORF Transcript_41155/g.102385 Transcript_41155/m.102385 type:complete len:104 (-) Transcript_41155:186-497(-)